ncbi:MAG TPA: shikimate kinase [Methanocorpusculum sp.]|nr:shikimate kinase [Methanocorpusculum sp.]
MTGYGVSGGALSIVNAVSSGFGAAYGISLSTRAEVCEARGITLRINGRIANPFFAEALFSRFSSVSVDRLSGADISVVSDIPQSVGLKSSSAAANAIISALAAESGMSLSPLEILRLGCLASLDAGVSITGAYDDAAACLLGGAVFTDNFRKSILKRVSMPESLTAVIAVPPTGARLSSAFPKEKLNAEKSRSIFDAAYAGDICSAICRNGALVSEALGIKDTISAAALSCGAAAAGVSGTGPAVGILIEKSAVSEFLSAFRPQIPDGYTIICTDVRNGML